VRPTWWDGAVERSAVRSLADAPALPVVTNAALQREKRCKTGVRRITLERYLTVSAIDARAVLPSAATA
jgi:hypothetical protein